MSCTTYPWRFVSSKSTRKEQIDLYSIERDKIFITARKRSLGQGNIFSSMCQEFCPQGGGVCLSACWDTTPGSTPPEHSPPPPRALTTTPESRHPQGADPAWEQAPPRADTPTAPVQCMLGHTVNKRAVCILLECNLVKDNLTLKSN